jgi:hypothetical protein
LRRPLESAQDVGIGLPNTVPGASGDELTGLLLSLL